MRDRYLRDLAEGYPSSPFVDDVHQPEVEVEVDVLLGVNREAAVALQSAEAARDGHHLSRRECVHTSAGTRWLGLANTSYERPWDI